MKGLGQRAIVGGLSLLPVIFGGYLIYDKVFLALASGHAHERVGTIARADDPLFYWLSVGMGGVFGATIAFLGLWVLWRVLRSIRAPRQETHQAQNKTSPKR